MSEIANKEIVVFLADIPPGGIAGKHFHPGDEAIYMLQGSFFFQPEECTAFRIKGGRNNLQSVQAQPSSQRTRARP